MYRVPPRREYRPWHGRTCTTANLALCRIFLGEGPRFPLPRCRYTSKPTCIVSASRWVKQGIPPTSPECAWTIQVNDIVSDTAGTCRSYLIKYIGSRTGYAASCERRVRAVSGKGTESCQRTIEKSMLFGSNVTESDNSFSEGIEDLTTSGSGTGDIENGRQDISIPCWCRSSGVKGTASSSNLGWEKERLDRGSNEKPAVRKVG